MATPKWPRMLLSPTRIAVDLAMRPSGGGVSFSGLQTYVVSDPGIWSASYSSVQVGNAQRIRCFRAIAALLDGPSNPILVPVYDQLRAPWPSVAGQAVMGYGQIPFDDGAVFDDGTGFFQPVIMANVSGSASPRATTLAINIAFGGALQTGEFFSVTSGLTAAYTASAANTGNFSCGAITCGAATLGGPYSGVFTSATAYTLYDSTGIAIGSGTLGTAFSAENLSFTLTAGSTAAIAGDNFIIAVSGGVPRLYRVRDIQGVSGTVTTVTIRPPLRDALVGGETCDFDDPHLWANLATPKEMGNLDLDAGLIGKPTVNFIERLQNY